MALTLENFDLRDKLIEMVNKDVHKSQNGRRYQTKEVKGNLQTF